MRKLIFLFTIIASLVGCRSLHNNETSSFSDSDSPYVKEEPVVKKEKKPIEKKKIVVKEEKVKVIEDVENEVFKYYVIIGSFKVLENARNYKQTLLNEGFTPVILENENGLYRVSIAAYHDETEARTKVDTIRDQYQKYSDTWLLIRKS